MKYCASLSEIPMDRVGSRETSPWVNNMYPAHLRVFIENLPHAWVPAVQKFCREVIQQIL